MKKLVFTFVIFSKFMKVKGKIFTRFDGGIEFFHRDNVSARQQRYLDAFGMKRFVVIMPSA